MLHLTKVVDGRLKLLEMKEQQKFVQLNLSASIMQLLKQKIIMPNCLFMEKMGKYVREILTVTILFRQGARNAKKVCALWL